ncbi:MAG: acyl-CoA dehydratase activase-related protein [Bacilli bacterium]|nr:acyl-CoA dehydratase activase-related protein [Bacilli bacterium]MDD4808982.1 acyl-CoA dehydratase activase-related protein [Bacilli bacterium]
MKIGIPRAFLYFKYGHLWETFFKELGIDIIISPETTKETLQIGTKYSIDETCLSSKIYMGHVYSLIGKCDYIFVPRIATLQDNNMVCTKFHAVYDLVNNTFKEYNIKILDYNVDHRKNQTEMSAFLEMGQKLNKKKFDVVRAYYLAKQNEKRMNDVALLEQEQLLKINNKIKLLIVAHPYNVYDKYMGEPILKHIEELDCIPIIADIAPKEEAIKKSKKISPTLPWLYNKELLGTIELYKKDIDGIILMTSFPCGPDALVNEIILRRVKDKPIINLILDEQEGTAGRETRIESFVDIIKLKKGDVNGKEKN